MLVSADGVAFRMSDPGAALVEVYVPASDSNLADVGREFDAPDGNPPFEDRYLGATAVDDAERVAYSRFSLGGHECVLAANDLSKRPQGGPECRFSRIMWQAARVNDALMEFTYRSAVVETNGYPKQVTPRTRYRRIEGSPT